MPLDSRYSGAIGGAARGASIGSAFGPWGTAIGGAAGGVLGGLLGGGEDDAKELAKKQEEFIQQAYRENRRRAEMEMFQTLGTARAAVGGSNIQFSGSPQRYTQALESEYRRQMAWDQQKARIDQEMVRLGGQMAADQIRYSGLQGMIGGLGSAFNAFAPVPQTAAPSQNQIDQNWSKYSMGKEYWA